MQILEDLWYGNICPIAQPGTRDQEHYDLVEQQEQTERELRELLTQKQTEKLEALQILQQRRERKEECDAFQAGLRLALQLVLAEV